MRYTHSLWAGLLSIGLTTSLYAEDAVSQTNSWDTLKQLKLKDLAIDANVNQDDMVKDPLQLLNRQIYKFNDVIDRNIARPLAVQYVEKVPKDVRGSYRAFKENLSEPWNAVNQLIQGKPLVATKTLGRFTINTLTTLGFADPASRLGLMNEDESLGTTLGYYGVPSGPYLVLPILGPSTLRNGLGMVADSQARPQKYLLDDQDALYWSSLGLNALDTRAQLLDVDGILQGDKYASLRDIYLQRQQYIISQKRGEEETFEEIDVDFEEY